MQKNRFPNMNKKHSSNLCFSHLETELRIENAKFLYSTISLRSRLWRRTPQERRSSVKARRILIAAFIVLCAATISVVAYSVQAESTEPFTKSGQYYRAELLEETPQDYFVLTNPDPWLLQAINNPGTWVYVENQYESSFLQQPSLESPFEYEGSFYSTEIIFIDLWPSQVLAKVAQIGTADSWIAFGTLAVINRKRLSS
jgi:hypothetical protein